MWRRRLLPPTFLALAVLPAAFGQVEVVQIAAGGGHTCALTASGGVKCWGGNIHGEAGGVPYTSFFQDRLEPGDIDGLTSGVKAIGVGDSHSCAVTVSGQVRCWGNNGGGQLGTGDTTSGAQVREVGGLPGNIVAVAGGYRRTYALTGDGRVLWWGLLRYDLQCGGGWGPPQCNTVPVITGPQEVAGVTAARAIHASFGSDRFCVVNADATAWCGSQEIRNVTAIGVAGMHRCVLLADGYLSCEGNNSHGELGIGTSDPVAGPQVPGIPLASVDVAAGSGYTCALQADGRVLCWGYTRDGRLGRDTGNAALPGPVAGIEGSAIAITAGGDHACAITARRGVKCWGAPRRLGDGSTTQRIGAVDVTGLGGVPVNHQGLWWNSPAGSESGWGIQIDQQGGRLFAVWFTYGDDGKGQWFLVPGALRKPDGSYSGALYQAIGPRFDAQPWDPSAVRTAWIGWAVLHFSDADNGYFAYGIGNRTASKQITRLKYGWTMPTCVEGGSPGAKANYQGFWWCSPAASESGWGLSFTHQDDILVATWFTYGAAGTGRWLIASRMEPAGIGRYAGALYETRGPAFHAVPWNAQAVSMATVGHAEVQFSDASNGVFAYTLDGISQSKPITRLVYDSPVTVCR